MVDEAQAIKNAATKQATAIRSLPAGTRIAVTGTPVENRLADLWSILEFANPGLLGSASGFRKRYAEPIERHGDDEAADRLRRFTGPFVLRRVKTDKSIISDLPDKLEMDVLCNLTAEQAALYRAVVDDMMARIENTDGIERRGLVLATMTKLKQVCNHPAHFLRDGSALAGRSGKLERLDEILDEVLADGEKALLFTQYAEFGAMLRGHLAGRFGREVLFLHGGVGQGGPRRDGRPVPATGAGPPPLFVLSLKAGGTGLTLTAANHVVHVDRWWNPAVEDQATDRAFRIGQRRNVQVRKFVCAGTLEEKIAAMIRDKRGLAARIVGTGEEWLTELSTGQLRGAVAPGGGGGGRVSRPVGRVGRYPARPGRARSRAGSRPGTGPRRDRLDLVVAALPGRARVVRHGQPARPAAAATPARARSSRSRSTPGAVRPSVQGSRPTPYQVTIGFAPLAPTGLGQGRDRAVRAGPAQRQAARRRGAARAGGDLRRRRRAAVPAAVGDLDQRCSCPDWEVPCKHLAATFYLLAEAFDADPFLILRWRGRDRERAAGPAARTALRSPARRTPADRRTDRRADRRRRAGAGRPAGAGRRDRPLLVLGPAAAPAAGAAGRCRPAAASAAAAGTRAGRRCPGAAIESGLRAIRRRPGVDKARSSRRWLPTRSRRICSSSSPSRPWKCAECLTDHDGGEFLTMDDAGPVCMPCADLAHLEFLARGDAALTRRTRKHSGLSGVVVKWSRSRKRYERQGIIAESDAIERAEQECLADADARERRRQRAIVRRDDEDNEFVDELAAAIREQFPGCPADRATRIAKHAGERSSGRIGRTAAGRALGPGGGPAGRRRGDPA